MFGSGEAREGGAEREVTGEPGVRVCQCLQLVLDSVIDGR